MWNMFGNNGQKQCSKKQIWMRGNLLITPIRDSAFIFIAWIFIKGSKNLLGCMADKCIQSWPNQCNIERSTVSCFNNEVIQKFTEMGMLEWIYYESPTTKSGIVHMTYLSSIHRKIYW